MGQKSMEWSLPLVFGATDIPKCFDELHHSFLLRSLLEKGVPRPIAAWFIREARNSSLRLRLGCLEIKPIHVRRGVPQGSKYGPRLCASALHHCINPVWNECQRLKLGFDTGDVFVPFVFFCDNILIFAHSVRDYVEISNRLKRGLEEVGWRLPDDRMECQLNRHVPAGCEHLLANFTVRLLSHSFKILGSKGSVSGTSHADITFKQHICTAVINARCKLWSCPGVCRGRKIELMHKVASTSFCWTLVLGPPTNAS